MHAKAATALGTELSSLARQGRPAEAKAKLAPVLAERTPFPILDRVGKALGTGPLRPVNRLLTEVARSGAMGGWVVIGAALGEQLGRDRKGALARARRFATMADCWYGADILGERVPGRSLVEAFEPSLRLLTPWRGDPNRWVRRMVGVSLHVWAKRNREGAPQHATRLLALVEPMFEEREMDVVKAVGWGLKSLGRHHPELLARWLAEQIVDRQRPHRAAMRRKAITYLSPELGARATGQPS